MRWRVPPMWRGRTVFIIGGGPSINDMDVDRLYGERVIGCNNAYLRWPWIDVTYFRDGNWWLDDGHHLKTEGYRGLLVTSLEKLRDEPGVKWLRHNATNRGVEHDPSRIVRGSNAGHEAINLAYHLGARRIVLLGFDMTRERGDNWHTDHSRTVDEDTYQRKFLPGVESTAEPLAEAGIEVLNVSPVSRLTAFPRCTLDEALRRCETEGQRETAEEGNQ